MKPLTLPAFNEDTLPDDYLPPPFPVPYAQSRKVWVRNWNLFYISKYWTGRQEGKNTVLKEWVALVEDKDDAPSRQLVHASIKQVGKTVRYGRKVNWTAYHNEIIKTHLQSDLVPAIV